GRGLHEAPESIFGYYEPRDPRRFHEGMVIAVEPFLSTKSSHVRETDDGWTLVGERGSLSAQYEHTLIVTRGAPIVVKAQRTPEAGREKRGLEKKGLEKRGQSPFRGDRRVSWNRGRKGL